MPNSLPANNDAPADGAGDFSHPNDLSTELNEAQEQELINEVLGIGGANATTPTGNGDQPADGAGGGAEAEAKPGTEEPEVAGEPKDAEDAQEPPTPPAAAEEPKEPKAPKEALDENGVKVDDLYIEVENSEGKTVKLVFDPANPNAFLPDDFTFKSDKQLFEILDAKTEMANIYKERSSEFDTKNQAAEEKAKTEETQQQRVAALDAEIDELIDGGILAAPKAKPANGKQYTPEEIAADPALQAVEGILQFMHSENEKRASEGKPLINSFGTAYTIQAQQKAAEEAAAKAKADAEIVKAKGSIVGGTSAASGGEKKVYRAGSHANIWDVEVDV